MGQWHSLLLWVPGLGVACGCGLDLLVVLLCNLCSLVCNSSYF